MTYENRQATLTSCLFVLAGTFLENGDAIEAKSTLKCKITTDYKTTKLIDRNNNNGDEKAH